MASGTPINILQRLKDLLAGEPLANLVVVIAVGIGFFHGWMKLKMPGPVTTFAFDIPLVLALALVIPRCGSLLRFFPPSQSGRALVVFYAVLGVWCVLALVLPGGAPLLAALAAFRAWAFSSLMFGLGYQIIRSVRQLHGYFLLLILMGAATSLYAIGQSDDEVRAMAALDPALAIRIRGQAFVNAEGEAVLRRFSTFISSGAFGATMSSVLLFVAVLITDRRILLIEKWVLGGLAVLIGWGMFLSGARSAMLSTVLGIVFIGWFRRSPLPLVGLVVVLGLGLLLGQGSTGGGTADRLASLDFHTVWMRFYIVWSPGLHYLLESWLVGGGLGRSTAGLPMFLMYLTTQYDVWGVDGDLGKVMAEMGIVGVAIMGWLFTAVMRDGFRLLRENKDSSVGTLSLGAVVCFGVSLITFPIGSPFLGIPMGALTWFLLGAAIKVDRVDRAEREVHAAPSTATAVNRDGPLPTAPRRKNFMYESRPAAKSKRARRGSIPGTPAQEVSGSPPPPPPGPAPAPTQTPSADQDPLRRRGKSFLYPK